MNEADVRLLLLNASTFIISFAQIEMALKISLLLISIGYTAQKWYLMHKNNGSGE